MVRKIRIKEQPTTDESPTADATATDKVGNSLSEKQGAEVIKLLTTMDWKLWEILQTFRRLEKKISHDDYDDYDD
jgi:hypothetical protein